MSKSKKYLIVFVSIILLLTSVYNIQFKYLKYYEGVLHYIPTEEEKEFIVYVGEKGYECGVYFYEETMFIKFDELSDSVTINCHKEIDKSENSKEIIDINGITYDVRYAIAINKIEGDYYVSISSTIYLMEEGTDNFLIDYHHIFSPYYGLVHDKIYTEDVFSLYVGGNSCVIKDSSSKVIEEYLLNMRDITVDDDVYFGYFENDDVVDLNEEVKICNEILESGYGEAMFYDVIVPIEKELQDIHDYGEKVFN